jgi:hypothetical protein
VDVLDAMLKPTAADLYVVSGDVEAALSEVDERIGVHEMTSRPRP